MFWKYLPVLIITVIVIIELIVIDYDTTVYYSVYKLKRVILNIIKLSYNMSDKKSCHSL